MLYTQNKQAFVERSTKAFVERSTKPYVPSAEMYKLIQLIAFMLVPGDERSLFFSDAEWIVLQHSFNNLKLEPLREQFTRNGLINEGVIFQDVIKYIKTTEPSTWDFIKHYAQIIWEYIRNVNHEETNYEKHQSHIRLMESIQEFYNNCGAVIRN